MKKSLLFFALVLASYGTIQAQVTTSSMTGVVTQTNGSTTSGATIKATHLPSGTAYSGSANDAGRFNLSNMRVGGPYRIEVTYVGQDPVVYEDVYLVTQRMLLMRLSLLEVEAVLTKRAHRLTLD